MTYDASKNVQKSFEEEREALLNWGARLKANTTPETYESYLAKRNERRERYTEIEELKKLSLTDFLTGLPNRAAWDREIRHEYNLDRREAFPLLIFTFDFDSFKKINDGIGHATGDNAIKHVASIVRETLRDTDFVARVGGDEFWVAAHIVIAKEGDIAPKLRNDMIKGIAEYIMDKVRKAVENSEFPIDEHDRQHKGIAAKTAKITISTGGVVYQGDTTPLAQLLAEADKALYVSKESGKNTVTLHTKGTGIQDKAPLASHRRVKVPSKIKSARPSALTRQRQFPTPQR